MTQLYGSNESVKEERTIMELARPLVVLDLETTGVWLEKDKIIEIGLIRYEPGAPAKKVYHRLVNPGMPIPTAVSELTGITDDAVKDKPRFREIAAQVMEFLGDADLAGFNIERFDLPMLEREIGECGFCFEWRDRKVYDAQKIYHLNEKRDLTAAYDFYCQKKLEGAHSALADSEAVFEILEAQVKKYGQGASQLSALDHFEYKSAMAFLDKEKKFCWWNGKLYPMFGKYRRTLSLPEIIQKDRDYLEWVLRADFSDEVKKIVEDALAGVYPPAP